MFACSLLLATRNFCNDNEASSPAPPPPRFARCASSSGPPCMLGRPNQHKLRGASGPVATGPDADGRDRYSPWVFGTAGEHGPSVLRLLSSTDDREHVPHARQGSVRTRDQGSV